MKAEPERDVLGGNLRRSLGACDEQVARSHAEFLRRMEHGEAPSRRRRASTGLIALAASLLVCVSVIVAIVSTGSPVAPPEHAAGMPAQDEKGKKTQVSEEQSLQAQIALQEKILEKTEDEKDRALVQATIKTLRGELARVQKGKGAPKGKPDPADDRTAKLRAELDSVHMKMKNAGDADEKARLEMRAKEIGQELKLLEQGSKKEVNIKEVEMKLQKDPDNVEALVERGRYLIDQGKGAEALKDLDQAIQKKTDYAPAYLARGIANALLGNLEKADLDVKRGAELDPSAKKEIQYARGTVQKLSSAVSKESVRSPKETEQRIAALEERLAELRAMEANADLPAEDRARAKKDADRVQAEIEKLKVDLRPVRKKKE